MRDYKTLSEVCKAIGVSRRAIQGYEKLGLVVATDKNKYGHLLYGEEEQKRIKLIKLYQEMGFQLKEIKELIDASNDRVKEKLLSQLSKLRQNKERLEKLIAEVEKMVTE